MGMLRRFLRWLGQHIAQPDPSEAAPAPAPPRKRGPILKQYQLWRIGTGPVGPTGDVLEAILTAAEMGPGGYQVCDLKGEKVFRFGLYPNQMPVLLVDLTPGLGCVPEPSLN